MDALQWALLGTITTVLIYRALKRPPPSTRWNRFAQLHDLSLSPSTPFALARISGLWRTGESGAPIPVCIQILRRTRTQSEGIWIFARVPGGLPLGLSLSPQTIRSTSPGLGLRTRALARRIQENGLEVKLAQFFEDWPLAVITNGGVQIRIEGRVGDPLEPVNALVEICRQIDNGEARSPSDLVIAPPLLEDPSLTGALSSATIHAEAQAVQSTSEPGLSLQDWTPFGSPFGLTAPNMAPPGGSPTPPLPSDGEWVVYPEPSAECHRQLKALARSKDPKEQRALLRQLERQPVGLSQTIKSSEVTCDAFLSAEYRNGRSTLGPLPELEMNARIRHPTGSLIANETGHWAIQIVDWDPETQCLIGHRQLGQGE